MAIAWYIDYLYCRNFHSSQRYTSKGLVKDRFLDCSLVSSELQTSANIKHMLMHIVYMQHTQH